LAPDAVNSTALPDFPAKSSSFSARSGFARAAAVAAVLFVVLFWRLGAPSFWDPDEAHYAETTSELLATGDWWAPYYNEQPFFDKPIFFHQLQALSMAGLGETELGARLVPALAALALVLFTGWLGTRLISTEAGLVAALLLAVNPGIFGLARYAILDTVFTAFLFGGVGLLAVAALRDRPLLQYPGYLLIACAVLIKGPLALVLCGLAMVLAIAMSADVRRRLLGLHWIGGLAMALAVAAPWFIYMYLRFRGSFVAGYVLDENIKLFATDRFGDQPPFWFYFQILATGMLPWTGVVAGRLVDGVRAVVARRAVDNVEVLLWAWTIAVVGFFTGSRFKLDHYVFPAAPALCLLCARAWVDLRHSPDNADHRGARIGIHLVGPLLMLMGLAAAYFLLTQFDLPRGTLVVPAIVILCGVAVTLRLKARAGRPPDAPWIPIAAMTVIYTAIVLVVMPALERQKVVPDLARWVAAHAGPDSRVATYQLNRWNTAFRFYVDRHVTMLDSDDTMLAFFNDRDDAAPFYVVMLQSGYDEFRERGVALKEVYAREGMWATSGRALWRQGVPPTRFVVVTR
jgi:4-amino-4-deoxy-L-arabinose transferase-like glycosyltransferase